MLDPGRDPNAGAILNKSAPEGNVGRNIAKPGAIQGPETDRYALAMVMLDTLAPSLSNVPGLDLRGVSNQVYKQLVNSGDSESLGQRWLEGIMQGLDKLDFSKLPKEESEHIRKACKDAVGELDVAFRDNASAKTLVSQAFASAMPGESGLDAWDQLAGLLSGSTDLAPGDLETLQHKSEMNNLSQSAQVVDNLDTFSASDFEDDALNQPDLGADRSQ